MTDLLIRRPLTGLVLALFLSAAGAAPVAATAPTVAVVAEQPAADGTQAARRVIPLEAGSNFRDIGGYPAAGGRHVKWGLIYRSGGTPMLTAADQARIAGLGLSHMIDLRSDEERVLAPTRIDGVPYTAVGYHIADLMAGFQGSGGAGEGYRRMPELLAPQVRQVFAALLRGEGPVVYNCSAGQDRTGFVTALVLSALGTPYATIVEDYHLSTRYRRPEFEMPRPTAEQAAASPVAAMYYHIQSDPRARQRHPLMTAQGKPYLDFAFEEMKARWGGVDGYLQREIGLTPAKIAGLRARYTR